MTESQTERPTTACCPSKLSTNNCLSAWARLDCKLTLLPKHRCMSLGKQLVSLTRIISAQTSASVCNPSPLTIITRDRNHADHRGPSKTGSAWLDCVLSCSCAHHPFHHSLLASQPVLVMASTTVSSPINVMSPPSAVPRHHSSTISGNPSAPRSGTGDSR